MHTTRKFTRPQPMGHHSCCNKQKVRRGLWSPEEDEKLIKYVTTYGHGCWSAVPKQAGLQRCGKSCRLRWINYLRPDLKRGCFSLQEETIIIDLHRILGNRWAQIAKHLPGRTDNEVKNFWNSCIKKKLIAQGIDLETHKLRVNKADNVNAGVNLSAGDEGAGGLGIGGSGTPAVGSDRADNSIFDLKMNADIREIASRAFFCGNNCLPSGENVELLAPYYDAAGAVPPSSSSTAWTQKFPSESCQLSCFKLDRTQRPQHDAAIFTNDIRDDAQQQLMAMNTSKRWPPIHLHHDHHPLQQLPSISCNINSDHHNLHFENKIFLQPRRNVSPNSMLNSSVITTDFPRMEQKIITFSDYPADDQLGQLAGIEAIIPFEGTNTAVLHDQLAPVSDSHSLPQQLVDARLSADSTDSAAHIITRYPTGRMQLPKLREMELEECSSAQGQLPNSIGMQFSSAAYSNSYEHFDIDLLDSSIAAMGMVPDQPFSGAAAEIWNS